MAGETCCKGQGTLCQPFKPTTPQEFIDACSGKGWAGCGQTAEQCEKCEFCENCTDCTNCDKCKDTIYVKLSQNIDFENASTTEKKQGIEKPLFSRDSSCSSAKTIILYSNNGPDGGDEQTVQEDKKNPVINGLRITGNVFFMPGSFGTVKIYDVDFTNCILDSSSSSSTTYLYSSSSSSSFTANRCRFSFIAIVPSKQDFLDFEGTKDSAKLERCSEYIEVRGQENTKKCTCFGATRTKCTSEFWGTRCGLNLRTCYCLINNATNCAFRIHCREKKTDCSDHGTISTYKGIGYNCTNCVFALSKDCYNENKKEATTVEEGQETAVCTLCYRGGYTKGTCLFDKTLAGGICTCTGDTCTLHNLTTDEMTDASKLKEKVGISPSMK